MYLSTTISSDVLWALIACLICLLNTAIIYITMVWKISSCRKRADKSDSMPRDAELKPASVVIYSQSDADNLESLLREVLTQDYPTEFEVIVVNEGVSADIRDIVAVFKNNYTNLYLTSTPEGVVNLSRKKLALTLGVKAARYDIVVLTTTAAVIESPLWLRNMVAPFTDNNIEIVLGYAYVSPDDDKAFGKRRRAFDHVVESARWIGSALVHNPFRGTEYNLAYRKETFMRNKGFAHTLNLRHGDDDIFISEIARRKNTAVMLSEKSMVRMRHGNHPRIFNEGIMRRIFTESFIRRRPRFVFSLAGILQIAALVTCLAVAFTGYPDMTPAIVATVIIILMFALDIYTWRSAMKALKSRTMALTLPWFSITYPIRRIYYHIRARLGKQKKYTWD